MKLTPWFNGKLHKPKREGVYQLMSGSGRSIGFQYWDGYAWGAWAESPEWAEHERIVLGWRAADSFQHDDWRGLAKKP